MVMVVGVVVVMGRPDKDPIHMQHRVEVDQVILLRVRVFDVQNPKNFLINTHKAVEGGSVTGNFH